MTHRAIYPAILILNVPEDCYQDEMPRPTADPHTTILVLIYR